MSAKVWLRIAFVLIGGLPAAAQIQFRVVKPEVIEERLQSYKGNDNQREATLKAMFETVGCRGDKLTEQAAKGLKQPNLSCILPGTADSTIVVGAHFDHVSMGDGVIDNWTGASLLPSLYEAISAQQRRHTFVFVAFAGEEKGLVGSRSYVQSLTPQEVAKMLAMVNLDTLGLGPTEVWASRSDPSLVHLLNVIAHAMNLPLFGTDVENVGMSDEESFIQRKVPTVTIHSLTQATLPILHSFKDKYAAVKQKDYYDTCRLLSAYLALLDEKLPSDNLPAPKPSTP